ncbi:winged helix-turn-helix domain-containing protein [Pseudomonas sp. NPDC012596]|uniref:winged helix-turn-helix domain-containing protein n=1 Tax=Pseudomonas sp. NPDC012596 TaxID=3364419 RepID=UPI0036CF32D2
MPNKILRVLQDNQSLGSRDIAERVNASWSTVKRVMASPDIAQCSSMQLNAAEDPNLDVPSLQALCNPPI